MWRARPAAVTAGLLFVMAACPGSDPPVPDGTPPEVGRGCAPLSVAPGTGPIAWTLTAKEQSFVEADPVAVGDGFLVGLNRCIGLVESSGRVRWTITGVLVDAFRIRDGAPLWTTRGPDAGPGASRGGKRARLVFAGDTGATMVGLTGVVALRHPP